MKTGSLDLGSHQQLAEHVLARPVDFDAEGHEPIPEIFDYLTRYPLGPALLDSVTFLDFCGSHDIYTYVHYFWDGEEAFEVTSLEGIGHLAKLERLHVVADVVSKEIEAEACVLASRLAVESFLRSCAPEPTAALSRSELAGRIVEWFARGWQLGLVSERALGRFCYLMFITADHLLDQQELVDFIAHGPRSPDAQIEALMLAIAAGLDQIALWEMELSLVDTLPWPDATGDEGPSG
ncbi:MAG: hypothetical protein M0T80_01955 [Actinomycetota bacterium]|nr:hypothetical protein [Actinomycetota bacterium]